MSEPPTPVPGREIFRVPRWVARVAGLVLVLLSLAAYALSKVLGASPTASAVFQGASCLAFCLALATSLLGGIVVRARTDQKPDR